MTNYARKLEKKEIREARFAIAPMLQAEEDVRYVKALRDGAVPPNQYKSPNLWFPPSN